MGKAVTAYRPGQAAAPHKSLAEHLYRHMSAPGVCWAVPAVPEVQPSSTHPADLAHPDTLSLTSATKAALRDSMAVQGDPCCLLWKTLNHQQKGVIKNCQGNLGGKDVGNKQQGRKYGEWACVRELGGLRKPHKPENKETVQGEDKFGSGS